MEEKVGTSKFEPARQLIESKLTDCRRTNRSLLICLTLVAIISCFVTFSVTYTYLSAVTSVQPDTPTHPTQTSPKSRYQNQTSTNNEELNQNDIEQLLKYYFNSSTSQENAL